jgi:hypothetical protein
VLREQLGRRLLVAVRELDDGGTGGAVLEQLESKGSDASADIGTVLPLGRPTSATRPRAVFGRRPRS